MIGDITLTITFDRGDCKDYVYIKTFSITYETLVHRVKQDKRKFSHSNYGRVLYS